MTGFTLIASHRPALRAWLRSYLPPCERVIETCDGLTSCQRALIDRPDLAVVTETLPHLDGAQTVAFLQAHLPGCRVILLPDPPFTTADHAPMSRWQQLHLAAVIDAALQRPLLQPA